MVDLVERVQIIGLLEQLAAQRDELLPHEMEMLAHLKEKYAEPITGSFDDKLCLEVLLRNIALRKEAHFDKTRDQRSIELERKS